MTFLIVGLGNPGNQYKGTRHNIGFDVLEQLAGRFGWSFCPEKRLEGRLAQGIVNSRKVFLLLPETYMNHSGRAVRKALDYYKLAQKDFLVVLDDVYVEFGRFRLRLSGTSGGHNGLKSIDESTGSGDYARLRVGVGLDPSQDLSSYVLGRYKIEELPLLPEVLGRTVNILEKILDIGMEQSLQYANSAVVSGVEGEKKA